MSLVRDLKFEIWDDLVRAIISESHCLDETILIYFCFWNKISCIPGWLWSHYVASGGWELLILLIHPPEYKWTHTYMHTKACIHTHTLVCMHTSTGAYICVQTQRYMHSHTFTCTHMLEHTWIYTNIYTCIYTHGHMYAHYISYFSVVVIEHHGQGYWIMKIQYLTRRLEADGPRIG